MDVGKLFFSWEGRIGRQEFWLGWLALFAVTTLLGWIPIIGALVGLVALYCRICVYAKRLHDMGRTGWLQLFTYVAYAVALVLTLYTVMGMIVAGVRWENISETALAAGAVGGILVVAFAWLIAFLIDLGFLLWVGISERSPLDNRWGPAPLTGDYRDALPIV